MGHGSKSLKLAMRLEKCLGTYFKELSEPCLIDTKLVYLTLATWKRMRCSVWASNLASHIKGGNEAKDV